MDKTNPACPNYVDPCLATTEFESDFVMEQRVSSPDTYFEVRSFVLSNSPLRLRINTPADSVKWIIGADIIEANEYTFTFPEEFEGQTLPLTMITRGTPNSDCFPNDNGRDTVTKYVRVISRDEAPIFGTFRIAKSTAPLDSFDVYLNYVDDGFDWYYEFDNLIPSEYYCVRHFPDVICNATKLEIRNSVILPCWGIKGVFEIDENNRFTADFSHVISIDPINSDRIEVHASGRKLE
ncbi:MAG: hypothetical protein R2809_09105 [Flavobacteriales bacterium]